MRATILLVFFAFLGSGLSDEGAQKPLDDYPKRKYYICDGCVPRELVHAPGIGFDLSSSYGTAAIRYHNGTMVDIGRVDGGQDYKDFMVRLSAPWKKYGPPFDTPLDQMEYELDQAKRHIRRARGLPSTEDISTLAYMLSNIKYMIVQSLHMSVHQIVLSLPYMPNFLPEDLKEAMELTSLAELQSFKHYGPLHNANAAWAGMGLGICEHWQDIEMCGMEEDHLKMRHTLALTYTYDELVVEVVMMYSAHHSWRMEHPVHFPDLSYGTWDMDRSNSTYWETIGRKVVEITKRWPRPIEEMVLMGEYAEEKRFLDSIWKALGGTMESMDVQKLWAPLQRPGFKAEFIAARGAAEMAKRWQGETWNCVEGDWCKGNRDYVEH